MIEQISIINLHSTCKIGFEWRMAVYDAPLFIVLDFP